MNEYDQPAAVLGPEQLDRPGTDYAEKQARQLTEDFFQGPSLYPLDGSERLRVWTAGSVAGVVVTVTARILNRRGRIQRLSRTVTPSTNRAIGSTDFELGEGFFLDVTARATTGTPLVGQSWIILELVTGLGGEKATFVTLAAGYLTPNAPVFGPASQYASSLDTNGAARSVQVTTPGAGADWSVTVPTNARWELTSFAAQLVTSAAVANRAARVIIDDGANTVFEVPNPAVQAANLTVVYSYGAGAGGPMIADAPFIEAPIPNDFYVPAGFRIRSTTGNLQAADQWNNINLYVREWIET